MLKWFVERPIRLFLTAGAAAVLMWFVWALYGQLIATRFGLFGISEAGQWGDTFGALNALFGALGFAAIFATLATQQAELTNQKSRLDEAEKARHIERFEGSLMELLALMRELRREIRFTHSTAYNSKPDVERSERMFEGAMALKAIETEVTYWIAQVPNEPKELIAQMYETTVHRHAESTLSPFFRVAYTILRKISEDSVLNDDQKASYGNLVRAQMTTPELTIAGINGLHAVSANFANFLTEFRMFKYLPHGVVRTMLVRFYPASAFQGRD